jgi:Zn-dependent protease
MVAVFACILIHELGHAALMRSHGFHPRIVLHGFGGLATYERAEVFGKRPSPLGEIAISLAGPGAGFLLAAVVYLAFKAAGHPFIGLFDPLGIHVDFVPHVAILGHPYFQIFTNDVFWVCVFWGLINLLPVFPLDGGQIAQQAFVLARAQDSYRQAFMLSIMTAVCMVALALVRWHDWYLAALFGYLAYTNYTMLVAYHGRGPWE